ncbi:uncharacterized protein LOC143711284 [Siphateles boraxobius]|uniref:uncharacterized protein LOC143711284 n=1 Tax=Siphateles boraxobius TaxID=180520 RepID=UPI004062C84A
MDSGRDKPELTRSSEGPSMSDFDRGFCTDQSLSLSAVSSDGFLRQSKGVVQEYSEPNPCLNYSTSLYSPLVALKNILSPGNSPVQGKSSTPYERVKVQKLILGSSLDLSCVDLTVTHPSWEVSLVKAIVESPKSCLESTWSPINPSEPPEISLWAGPDVSGDLQRSWREMVWQGSGQALAIPDLREEPSSPNLAI